jgi:ADP-ribosylglycohydrolase
VETALTMPGGGRYRLAPGQVTDDGELTITLARAIVGKRQVDLEEVAEAYASWLASRPFDCGIATGNAFTARPQQGEWLASKMRERSLRLNSDSKANGALMRSVGLAIWSCRQTVEEAAETARADARLSHPNPSCQHASAAYVVAVRHLILNPDDGLGAIEAAFSVLYAPDAQEARGWLEEACMGEVMPDYYPLAGFVRIAFTHAFGHLHRQTPYVEALMKTYLGGGDTDTNGCIIGGLLGAFHGVEKLPENLRDAIMNCDPMKGRPRPDWLVPKDALALAEHLLACT